jgi:hypothetical protein
MGREVNLYSGFTFHPAQQALWDCPARFIVADWGRRAGKSETAKWIAAKTVADGKRVAYLCPTNKLLSQFWRDIRELLSDLTREKSEQEHRLELISDGILECWSLESTTGPRGRSYDVVIVDEAAMVPSDDFFVGATMPTISDREGRVYFLSTPQGQNWFWEYYNRGEDPLWPDWASFKFPTSVNPKIKPTEIELARRVLPDRRFREEYLAEFIGDDNATFRNIDKLSVAAEQDEAIPGHIYTVGVDWGKVEDFSCFAVFDVTTREIVHLDRSNNVEYTTQISRLAFLNERFHPMVIYIEDNSIAGVMEQISRLSLPVVTFHTSAPLKMMFVDAFASALEREDVRLLDHAQLKNELKMYRPERLPSGLIRYSAPEGQHDDTVIAVMAAYYCAQNVVAGEAGYYRFA